MLGRCVCRGVATGLRSGLLLGPQGQRQDWRGGHGHGHDEHGGGPAVGLDEALAKGHHEELPEACCGDAQAHGPGAALWRHELPECGQHNVMARPTHAQPNENAGAQAKRGGIGRHSHERQAHGKEHPAASEHPPWAEAVGQRTGNGLANAPGQVLKGQRKGKGLAAKAKTSR